MDSYDYQRSSLPSRLSAHRGLAVPASRPAAGGPGEATGPSPLSARAVLRASRRYWWLILALWTVGISGLGALIYLKVRPQYPAMALLKVDPNMLDLYGSSNQAGGTSYMQTYVELIKSPAVLDAASHDDAVGQLPRIKYSTDPIQELTKAISVGIRTGTHLIEVSTVSPSPDEAMILVNTVVEKFIDQNRTWSGGSAKVQIEKLGKYHEDLKSKAAVLENQIKILAARGAKVAETRVVKRDKADGPEPKDGKDGKPGKVDWDVEHYQNLVGQCLEVKTELILAEARRDAVRRAAEAAERLPAGRGPQAQVDAGIEIRIGADPEVREVRGQQVEAYNKWATAKRRAANPLGDPAVAAARRRCIDLEAALDGARDRARQRVLAEASSVGTGKPTPALELQKAEADVQQLTLKRDALEGQLGELKVETNKHMTEEVEVRFLEDQRRYLASQANIIQTKLDSLNWEQMNEERIYLIDKARRAGLPTSDKRKLYLAAMPFGVLGVVLALAVLLEVRSGRVADPEFLSARVPHEVFAVAPLPTARVALGSDDDRNEQRLARFVQSLDHLRVALCEGGTAGEGRCVMITSATGGEGKTTLSAHLAARCANAGTATLLIDADLRRGSLGRLLDVPAGPGLGDLLAGQVELDGGLISTQAGGFHFLSVGTPGIDPTRVLRSTRLAELIGQLRQTYDLIIIDTPPVLPVADALILGRWADGAVVAARYDASRLPLLERANRQIAAAGIPVLGVVVNGVRVQDQAYGSYAYNYAYPGTGQPSDGGPFSS